MNGYLNAETGEVGKLEVFPAAALPPTPPNSAGRIHRTAARPSRGVRWR